MKATIKLFQSPASQERIRKAISDAESNSSAEIVPMIVRSSIATEHVAPILTLILLIVSLVIYFNLDLFQLYPLRPWMILLLLVGICIIFGQWGARLPWVQMCLTHRRAEQRDVERRALFEFYSLKMDHTIGKTGILLFLSLQEHRAVVLADRNIAEKLSPEVWQSVIEKLISVARRDAVQGLTDAIAECARIVAPVCPRHSADKNEIPDRLIVKN